MQKDLPDESANNVRGHVKYKEAPNEGFVKLEVPLMKRKLYF